MDTNHESDIQNQEDKKKEEQKKKQRRRNLTIAGVIALIVVILLMLHTCGNGKQNPDSASDPLWDENLDDPWQGKTPEEIQEALNNKLEAGMINVAANTDPVFEDGSSKGNLLIYNEEQNNYPQKVEIYLKDTNELVYESGLIPVGKAINEAALLVDLDAGDYPAIGYFHNIDPETGESLGKAGAEMTLHINN